MSMVDEIGDDIIVTRYDEDDPIINISSNTHTATDTFIPANMASGITPPTVTFNTKTIQIYNDQSNGPESFGGMVYDALIDFSQYNKVILDISQANALKNSAIILSTAFENHEKGSSAELGFYDIPSGPLNNYIFEVDISAVTSSGYLWVVTGQSKDNQSSTMVINGIYFIKN